MELPERTWLMLQWEMHWRRWLMQRFVDDLRGAGDPNLPWYGYEEATAEIRRELDAFGVNWAKLRTLPMQRLRDVVRDRTFAIPDEVEVDEDDLRAGRQRLTIPPPREGQII